jgi:putative chitinase
MAFYKMTPERAAHFFGQTSHETGGFQIFTENLNYSAKGLLTIFKKYFTAEQAEDYARQPVKIGSRVYANRMGNGNEASKEGFKFCGRGALQTTGKSNYKEFSDSIKKPEIMDKPELVATDYAFEAAIFFFEKNKLWAICDQGVNDKSILALTKRINGGTHGLEDRVSQTKRFYKWLTQ